MRYGAVLVAGSGASPFHAAVRLCDVIHRVHDALRDVADVGEVAAVMAVVEDVDRLAGQDVLREQEQRHVGPAERAVHREEPQARDRQPVQARVRVRHELVALLRRRVQRQRMVDVLVHGERHLGVRAVDGARRGEHEVLDAVVAAAFEHRHRALHVAVDVRERMSRCCSARRPARRGE